MLTLDLTGKTALITGATGELGRVIARTLAGCGANIAIHYHRSAERAAVLQQELADAGGRVCTVQADITCKTDVDRMRDEVDAKLGAPAILVNNAVIQYQWVPVLEQSPDDYRSQFESCVLHNVLMAQAFVPAMIAQQWGRIIAINTECAMQCMPSMSAYASGKRGMDGVIRVLAREIGMHNITVNQVAPGWMISDKYRSSGGERQPDYERNVPLRHRGEDQDIANTVAFLASDLAKFITGAYIPVSGGNVMPCI